MVLIHAHDSEPCDGTCRLGLEVVAVSVASERSYTAFGLVVDSEIDLPELTSVTTPTADASDVRVRHGPVESPADADPETVGHRVATDDHYLQYEAATVRIRDGREIVVDPAPGVPSEIIRHLVLGPAFNHLLHQRQYLVLHASTVVVDGVAVAFLGASGDGKTTTAAAFLRAGHRILSDDVAAVVPGTDPPQVRNGYPSIKLDPTLVDEFDLPVTEPTDTTPKRDRHFYGLRHDDLPTSVPLTRVYLLTDSDRLAVTEVDPPDRVMTLVEHTYTRSTLETDEELTANFRRSGDIARTVPIKRLERPRQLAKLPKVVERVVADLDDPADSES